jgi:hypothetical protein
MLLTLAPPTDTSITAALRVRHDQIAEAGPQLQPGIAPWTDEPLIGLHRGRVWLVVPAPRDPLRTSDGRYIVPAQPLSELRRIAASGLHFHHIAIAHELEPTGPARHLLPALTDGPRTCTDQVARRLVPPFPGHPSAARLALVMDRVAGGVVQFARTNTGLLSTFLTDPIIFGVVGCRGAPVPGEPALWYPLAAWEW